MSRSNDTHTQICCGQYDDRMYKGRRRRDLTTGDNGDLALGPHEHGFHNDMRAGRRYERQLSTLGSLSFDVLRRERGQDTEKKF